MTRHVLWFENLGWQGHCSDLTSQQCTAPTVSGLYAQGGCQYTVPDCYLRGVYVLTVRASTANRA